LEIDLKGLGLVGNDFFQNSLESSGLETTKSGEPFHGFEIGQGFLLFFLLKEKA